MEVRGVQAASTRLVARPGSRASNRPRTRPLLSLSSRWEPHGIRIMHTLQQLGSARMPHLECMSLASSPCCTLALQLMAEAQRLATTSNSVEHGMLVMDVNMRGRLGANAWAYGEQVERISLAPGGQAALAAGQQQAADQSSRGRSAGAGDTLRQGAFDGAATAAGGGLGAPAGAAQGAGETGSGDGVAPGPHGRAEGSHARRQHHLQPVFLFSARETSAHACTLLPGRSKPLRETAQEVRGAS